MKIYLELVYKRYPLGATNSLGCNYFVVKLAEATGKW